MGRSKNIMKDESNSILREYEKSVLSSHLLLMKKYVILEVGASTEFGASYLLNFQEWRTTNFTYGCLPLIVEQRKCSDHRNNQICF